MDLNATHAVVVNDFSNDGNFALILSGLDEDHYT